VTRATTVPPSSRSSAVTGTSRSSAATSGASAVAVIVPRAFFRYSARRPFMIVRAPGGSA
jgi:hypothetical protein